MFLNIVSIAYLAILHFYSLFLRKEISSTFISNALENVVMATEYGTEDIPSCPCFPVVGHKEVVHRVLCLSVYSCE